MSLQMEKKNSWIPQQVRIFVEIDINKCVIFNGMLVHKMLIASRTMWKWSTDCTVYVEKKMYYGRKVSDDTKVKAKYGWMYLSIKFTAFCIMYVQFRNI